MRTLHREQLHAKSAHILRKPCIIKGKNEVSGVIARVSKHLHKFEACIQAKQVRNAATARVAVIIVQHVHAHALLIFCMLLHAKKH